MKKDEKDIEIEEQEKEINILLKENAELRRLFKKLRCCFNCGDFTLCQSNWSESRIRHKENCKEYDLVHWKEQEEKRRNQL